jgi:hypothetical protein
MLQIVIEKETLEMDLVCLKQKKLEERDCNVV